MLRPSLPRHRATVHRPQRRGAHLGVWLVTALLGCAARSDGGGAATPDATTLDATTLDATTLDAGGIDVPLAPPPPLCVTVCARLSDAPGCGPDATRGCEVSCTSLFTAGATTCGSSLAALLACAANAPVQCAGDAFPFVGCDVPVAAYAQCVASAPRDAGPPPPPPMRDAGSGEECARQTTCGGCTGLGRCGWCAGRCWVGTARGPEGGSCGDERWAWFGTQCPPPLPGGDAGLTTSCATCGGSLCRAELTRCAADPACEACVIQPGRAGCAALSTWMATRSCLCRRCASQCTATCAASAP